jgi:hypothetical protein
MLRMTDASGGETHQAQYRYQLEFLQPLVTEAGAQQSYNNLMSKIGSQTQINPDGNGQVGWSGLGNTVGNPDSGAAPSAIPSTKPNPSLGFAPAPPSSPTGAVTTGFGAATETTSAVTAPTPEAGAFKVETPATVNVPTGPN